jgi:hypothetical protein
MAWNAVNRSIFIASAVVNDWIAALARAEVAILREALKAALEDDARRGRATPVNAAKCPAATGVPSHRE